MLGDARPGMTGVPPGMTHDEADHGLTALSILDGARALYFPIGYGREPLYDYATAVVMRVTGPTILAGRLTSVYFSLLLIAAVYAWARRAFGAPVALLTAAGLAAGFWPLMTARQALRSSALPAVFALGVLFFWGGIFGSREELPRGRGWGEGFSAPLPQLPCSWLAFCSGCRSTSTCRRGCCGWRCRRWLGISGCGAITYCYRIERWQLARQGAADDTGDSGGRGRAAAALSGGAAGAGGARRRVERPPASRGRRRLQPRCGPTPRPRCASSPSRATRRGATMCPVGRCCPGR
jgi:hypothetical protein